MNPFEAKPKIEDEFLAYTFEYMSMANRRGLKLSDELARTDMRMSQESLGKNTIGICRWSPLGTLKVRIYGPWWNGAGEEQRRTLVFHELNHCLCMRSHNHRGGDYAHDAPVYDVGKGYLGDMCPASIMHPIMIPTQCLRTHQEHYDEEALESCRD
ncbi:MAG: hypothetical protein IT285_16225 [Bdellovibrionales bacterium]|nr:hypothetical protein [Bdellovibrionales bacterium]